MKGGGKRAGTGAAALPLLVLLIAATLCTGVKGARPQPNPCTHDQNNQGQKCHNSNSPGKQEAAAQSSPAVFVSKATSGPNNCTSNPGDPPGNKCHYPPPTAP